MQTRRFGATGLQLPPFGFGTMTLGAPLDESDSLALLDAAVDLGITHIDTANAYNAGRSEELIGRWLAQRGLRERVVLASKVRYAVGRDPDTAGLSPKVVVRELENSLRRLGTEYLDIYYLHQPDDDTPIEVTWRCLDALVSSGKIRYLGMSNYAAWQVVEAMHLARAHGWAQPLVVQSMYNAIARGIETELVPMTGRYDLATVAYNPLGGGLLTGRYAGQDEPPEGSRLAINAVYRRRFFDPRQRQAAERLAEIARAHGRTPVQLALRFLLDAGGVDAVLLGATRPEQLADSVSALEAPALDEEERREIDSVWKELSGPIPRYNRSNRNVKLPPRQPAAGA